MVFVLRIFTLIAILWAISNFASAQLLDAKTQYLLHSVEETKKRFIKRQDAWEQSLPDYFSDIRLIKTVSDAPPLLPFKDGQIALRMAAQQGEAIASLHHAVTGAPLQTCLTPCDIYGEPNTDYIFVFYKAGHLTKSYQANSDDWRLNRHDIYMGENYFELLETTKRCIVDFSASLKSDSDAEICVHISPELTHNIDNAGACDVLFDISPTGYPRNIRIMETSSKRYGQACEQAITWWFYKPKVEAGEPVWVRDVSIRFSSEVTDELGNKIIE